MGAEARTWEEFRKAGLLWWVNRMLHLFGWCIVLEVEGDEVVEAYPARTSFRGFPADREADGFVRLTRHLADSAEMLLSDVEEG